MHFTIRVAKTADWLSLCELWKSADELHRRAHPDLFRFLDDPVREEDYLRSLIDSAESTVLVAESDEHDLLGLATLTVRTVAEHGVRRSRQYVELDNLVVSPTARRRGVGNALVASAAEWAQQRGLGRLELQVFEFNLEALAFYRATGFTPLSRRLVRRLA